MADREESIHVVIRLDIDPDDREMLARDAGDAERQSQRLSEQGETEIVPRETERQAERVSDTEAMRRTIKEIVDESVEETLSSIGERPEHDTRPELEVPTAAIDGGSKKTESKVDDLDVQMESLLAGHVGKVQEFSTKQFGNLKSMVSNPTMFMMTAFMRKFVAAGLAVGIALFFWEIVTWVLDESFKAGRWLDRRFRRVAQEEIMGWWDRKTQEELRHGFMDLRVTTQQGLRGGQGQVNGNLFQFSSVTGMFQSSPYKSSEAVISNWSAKSQPTTTPQGNIRSNFNTRRNP